MSQPNRISFAFIALIIVLTGWLGMGALLLSVLFSYFVITKLDFVKPRGKWLAVAIFLALLAGLGYGLTYFIQATVQALPSIAEKAVPAIIQWATEHHITLPFTDLPSLKDKIFDLVRNQASHLGEFADFARGATTQFVYLIVGCLVAIGVFLDPRLDRLHATGRRRPDLYSLCCNRISRRLATFYRSFDMVMSAQISISAIDAALTGIFMATQGLPHLVVAVGVTFLCGLIPVVGNLISNTLVVALGFTVAPAKGLWALAFLVLIHQLEYLLNSKIIGSKIHTSIWLTLLALLLGERLMGVTGMVLAPVVLNYIHVEASKITVH